MKSFDAVNGSTSKYLKMESLHATYSIQVMSTSDVLSSTGFMPPEIILQPLASQWSVDRALESLADQIYSMKSISRQVFIMCSVTKKNDTENPCPKLTGSKKSRKYQSQGRSKHLVLLSFYQWEMKNQEVSDEVNRAEVEEVVRSAIFWHLLNHPLYHPLNPKLLQWKTIH